MSHLHSILKRIAALFGQNDPHEGAERPALPSMAAIEQSEEPFEESFEDLGYPHFAIDQRHAKFQIGQVVKHRLFDFRGVIFDVDPEFANSEEWYEAIPEHLRPRKDQPYYHLFAENEKTHYVAYVSEGNLVPDDSDKPVTHPDIPHVLDRTDEGYVLKRTQAN